MDFDFKIDELIVKIETSQQQEKNDLPYSSLVFICLVFIEAGSMNLSLSTYKHLFFGLLGFLFAFETIEFNRLKAVDDFYQHKNPIFKNKSLQRLYGSRWRPVTWLWLSQSQRTIQRTCGKHKTFESPKATKLILIKHLITIINIV